MKKRLTGLFLALIMVLCLVPASASAAQAVGIDLYVALDGNDANAGTIDSPLASLEGARDRIRQIKAQSGYPAGGICVYLREGEYSLSRGFVLTAEDSGTKDAPIVYRSYPNETATILGGMKIKNEDFVKVTDNAILKKIIDQKAAGKIYQVDLNKYGLTVAPMPHLGVFQVGTAAKGTAYDVKTITGRAMELFVNGEPQTVSRWPNNGEWATYTYEEVVNKDTYTTEHAKIKYKNERIFNWIKEDNYHLYGLWTKEWSDWSLEIANYDGEVIEFNSDFEFAMDQASPRSFYAYSLLCELDAPGEYYMDKNTNMLYYYPDVNLSNADVFVSTFEESVISSSADYINFKELTITAARGTGISATGRGTVIERCEIYNTAGFGAHIKGYDSGVVSSYIHDTNMGIVMDCGDRKTLTPGNSFIYNCDIERFCRITIPSTPGVKVYGVGNHIAFNNIHDAEQIALEYHGNEQLIEYNNIYNVCQRADDVAAVYTGKNTTYRGNVLQYNWVHDVYKGIGTYGCSAFYCDDQMSSVILRHNIMENIYGRGFQIEGGRNHVISDNLLINVDKAGVIRNRKTGVDYNNMDPSHGDYWIVNRLNEMPYKTGIWAEKYPELVNIMDPEEDMGAPRYNTVQNNIYVNTGTHEIYVVAEQYGTIKDNHPYKKITDVFKKGEAGVYEIDTTKHKMPFETLNANDAGLYVDDFYKSIDNSVVLSINNGGAIARNKFKLIDEGNISAVPFIENGRTLVPIRFIAENLGAEVLWNAEEQKVDIISGEYSISLVIGSNTVTVNGEDIQTEAAAQILSGRTYVPLRVVSEAFKKNVFWDDRGLIIIGDTEPVFSDLTKDFIIDELLMQMNLR